MDPRDLAEGQLRDCYGRVAYSHKTHEKCADILLSRLARIKLAQIILSAIATGGCVAALLGTGPIGAGVGAVFSTALLALNAYTKAQDLGEIAQKHRQAAADLWLIRERYLSLLTDLRIGDESLDSIRSRRDALLDELHGAYSGAPSTTVRAYKEAQKALQQSEEMTFSEKEIDELLPLELQRTPMPRDGGHE